MVAAQQAPATPQLRICRGQDLKAEELHSVLARPRIDFESILQTVNGRQKRLLISGKACRSLSGLHGRWSRLFNQLSTMVIEP